MLIDSEWWQGHLNSSSNTHYNVINNNPTDFPYSEDTSIEFSLSSAQTLAHVMDRLNSLDKIRFLNYHSVEFGSDSKSFLGDGSFSQVVKGKYKKKDVAIKTIYTNDLTLEIIDKIASEAKILSLLKSSQHVVSIYGLLLCPPSICIVLEYCSYGSLHNILRGYEEKPHEDESGNWTRNFVPPLAITVPEMLYLSLGAASGVHAVHSFSPLLCHRDIKSFNFLVDSNFIVKIADLELGDDHSPRFDTSAWWPCDCLQFKTSNRHSRTSSIPKSIINRFSAEESHDSSELPAVHPSVVHMQATWLAPETLKTGVFNQASDVYALGLVLWEIRTKQIPFSDCRGFQVQIRKAILSGYQEPFPSINESDIYRDILREFDELVSLCWHPQPKKRLKSSEIVKRLEMLVQMCGGRSLRTAYLDQKMKLLRSDGLNRNSKKMESIASELSFVDLNFDQLPPMSQLKLFLECHGGEWLLISSASPHQIIYRSNSWNNMILRRLSVTQRLLLEGSQQNDISFLDCLRSLLSNELNFSKLQSSFSQFLSSCVQYKYGNLVLPKFRSSSPSGKCLTLMLHGYLLESLSESSTLLSPFPIAILFSSLNSELNEEILTESTTSNSWNLIASTLLGKTRPSPRPSPRPSSSFTPGSSLSQGEIIQNEIIRNRCPNSIESVDEL